MPRRIVVTCWLCVLVVGSAGPVAAQLPDDSVRARAHRDFHGPDGTGKDGPLRTADLDLLMLYHRYRAAADTAAVSAPPGVRVIDGRVTVDAIAKGEPTALRADLERLGTTKTAVAGRVVSGRLPIGQIPAAARLESLRGLTPASPRTRSPSPAPPAPPPAIASRSDSTEEPTEKSGGPILLLVGGALVLLFLEEE